MNTSSSISASRAGERPTRFTIEPAARTRLRQWLVLGIALLAAAMAAESAYRVRLFGWAALAAPIDYAATRLDRFDLRWGGEWRNGLPVNYRGRNLGASFTTGSFGFRMADRPWEKPPGTTRLAVIGYSIDLGHGVSDDDNYVMRLQRMADAATRTGTLPPVEILNLSMLGPQRRRQARIYDDYARRFDADAVLLPLYLGMAAIGGPLATQASAELRAVDTVDMTILGDFYLTYAREHLRRVAGRTLGLPSWSKPSPPASEAPVVRAHALVDATLVRRIRAEGRAVLLVAMLRPLHPAATGADRAALAVLAAEFADDPCIRMLATLPGLDRQIRRDQTVLPWDYHPDAGVHALYAATIFPLLRPTFADPGACRAIGPGIGGSAAVVE